MVIFMKKKIPFIVLLILIVCIVGFQFFHKRANKTILNDGFVNGNTAGNLFNNGLFCESDGTIYFANPLDQDKLYSMDLNGGNVQKICDDVVSYLNADDNYVYYARTNLEKASEYPLFNLDTNSLCRLTKKNGKITILDKSPCMYPALVGNYLYYMHYEKKTATTLYKVKIDGTEQEQISQTPYYPCSSKGQYIYYNGITEDHNIHQYDTVTGSKSTIYEGNCWMPILVDNNLYFMDCDDNYKLAKVDLSTKEKTTLTTDRIDCFNLSGDYLYYQDNTTTQLCRVKTDGSENEALFDGNYTHINVTSNYIFFEDFQNGTMFYTSTSNPDRIKTFSPEVSE